jgi:N-acetylneuraminic acid mutarotase
MRKSNGLLLVLVFMEALFITSSMSAFNSTIAVSAQTDVVTSAFISVEPNPAEVSQLVYVTIRVEPAPPTPTDIFRNIAVTFIRSDGYKNTIGPFDTKTGSHEFSLSAPDLTGDHLLKVKFPGQTFANGDYYLPSEAQTTLTVDPPPPPSWSTVGLWTTKTSMHQARSVLGVVAVNGKIYAIGGSTQSGVIPSAGGAVYGDPNSDQLVGTNEEYDPTTNRWTSKTPMPTPRIAFGIAAYQGKIYCIGGRTGDGFIGVNEVYDPATDTWETKASMLTARGWLTASAANGKIYCIGGPYPNRTVNEAYDPATDSWETKVSMPIDMGISVSVAVDDKIYVISSKLQIYDPATDKWSQGTSPPYANHVAAGVTTGDLAPKRIYVIGIRTPDHIPIKTPSNQIYDPTNDSWTFGADIPTRRYNFAVAVLNDTLYAIGGHTYKDIYGDYTPTAANERYTPADYIPEFPSWTLTLLVLVVLAVPVAIYKRKLGRKLN